MSNKVLVAIPIGKENPPKEEERYHVIRTEDWCECYLMWHNG